MTYQQITKKIISALSLTLAASFLLTPETKAQSLREQLKNQTGDDSLFSEEERPWGLDITPSLLSSVMHPDEADYQITAFISTIAYYNLSSSLSLFAGIKGGKDLNRDRENKLSESYLGGYYEFLNEGNLSSRISSAIGLPFEHDGIKYDDYRGAIQISPSARYRLDSYVKGISLAARISLTRKFYRYYTNRGGQNLEKLSISYLANISYALPYQISLSASVGNKKAWDFMGDAYRTTYSSTQRVDYYPFEKWIFSLTHRNGGYTYDYNGQDFDIRLYDARQSVIAVSTTYSY